MNLRKNFNYGSTWARLIACLAAVIVIWPVAGGKALTFVDNTIAEALFGRALFEQATRWAAGNYVLFFVLSLLPAFTRVERPLALVGAGISMAAVYCALCGGIFLLTHLLLPLAQPLVGLICSTFVLGFMAWGEERQRRRELARMEIAKQRFTDMLVHDLKGRMSSLNISLSMLEKELDGHGERTATLFSAMRSSSMRMMMQFRALLDIRKMQEGSLVLQPSRIAIAHVVREALEEQAPLAELCGVKFETEGRLGDNALLDADPEMLSRVMANLLWNAVRAAPRGSTVAITIKRLSRTVEVAISNSGAVIPEAEKADLFQPFVSHVHSSDNPTSSAGTGLGLVFSKLAVEAHRGSIVLASPRMPEGDGVRVTMTLPVAVL